MRRVAAGALGALLLSACAPGTTTTASSPGGERHSYTIPHTLRYATAEDVAGLNPHLNQQTTLSYMSSLTMAWLTKFDRNNRPVPELTTVVPTQANGGISKDGLTITWHLRHDVKWSDGVPFTADDVVFSTKAVLNPANNEVGRDGWDRIKKIDEPDKYTVVYHLSKPYAAYAATFFGTAGGNPCVLPKHLLGNLPNINHAAYNALPIGTGPFKYSAWRRGDAIEMVPNPYYFRGKPKLQKIIFKIVPDRNTIVTQLRTHELDLWLPVASAFYEQLKTVPGVALLRQTGYSFNHLDFQNQHPGLNDPRVRRALRLAIDRTTLRDKIGHGLGIIQDDPVSPKNPSFDARIPTDGFDLAKAGAMLDAAGWKPGPDGVRAKNGQRLSFVFATSTGTPDADQRIELIRANWKKLGVAIDVRRYPSPLLFAPLASGGIVLGGKWDMIYFNWGGDPIGDLSPIYECTSIPPAGQNDPRYCNPAVDRAMEAFKQTYDERARQKYADIIQESIAKDVPIVVTAISEDVYAYNSDLKGFAPNQVSQFDDFMNVDI